MSAQTPSKTRLNQSPGSLVKKEPSRTVSFWRHIYGQLWQMKILQLSVMLKLWI